MHYLATVPSARARAPRLLVGSDSRFEWMSSQIEYISLSRTLLGTHARPFNNQTNNIKWLESDLKAWKANLPGEYQDIDQPHPDNLVSNNRKLWVFCQYHEAILRLNNSQIDRLVDRGQGLYSAIVIVQATSLFPPSVVHSYR